MYGYIQCVYIYILYIYIYRYKIIQTCALWSPLYVPHIPKASAILTTSVCSQHLQESLSKWNEFPGKRLGKAHKNHNFTTFRVPNARSPPIPGNCVPIQTDTAPHKKTGHNLISAPPKYHTLWPYGYGSKPSWHIKIAAESMLLPLKTQWCF